MNENSKAMDDLTKPWEEKLKEEKQKEKENYEQTPTINKYDFKCPNLTNLNEDP